MKQLTILCFVFLLCACSGGEQQELKNWMGESARTIKVGIAGLPPVATYVPFAYEATDRPDPFKPSRVDLGRQTVRREQVNPFANHSKEPLEAFPLESLKLVGTLEQDRKTYALIRADANVYRVAAGSYLGANFGRITAVSETEVSINETVQDASGDWTERTSSLQLAEQEGAKK